MQSLFSKTRALGILSAASVLVVMLTANGAAAGAKPKSHTVTIDGTEFSPAELTVNIGDTIVWVNKDPYPHTATSRTGGFDSKKIGPDKSWKYVAKKAGDFPYVCTIHPSMQGTLHVK